MKIDCDVVRDLLPLYADEACSEKSRALVEEHLRECPDCDDLLRRLRKTELESDLQSERDLVIQYGARRFKRRSAAVGSAVSGLLLIPILILLIVNIVSELTMNWFFVVLAALCVAASLIVVPLVVPKDRLFWTFCAFCASLMALLAVTCLYTHGDWFWIASSAVLFGMSVLFLPFLLKAGPVRKILGDANRLWIVLGVDAALFVNMLYTISHRSPIGGMLIAAAAFAGILAVGRIRRKDL